MLFTKRFIKDLILLGLFLIAFYILTHNSISYPRPAKTEGLYSIQLMQHPLVLGIAGHNYLVLRDGKDVILRELHGLATDQTTNTWKYIGKDNTDKLKVWEFTSVSKYVVQKSFAGIVLRTGTKEDIENIWQKALICKDEINAKNIPYPPYGINMRGDTENSNSVAYTLSLCMGLNTKQLGLFTPGSTRNLLEKSN